MAVEGKGRLGILSSLLTRAPSAHTLVNLGERGEERKRGGGVRALVSYTSWHSPEPRKASRRFIRLLWKGT